MFMRLVIICQAITFSNNLAIGEITDIPNLNDSILDTTESKFRDTASNKIE